MGSSKFFTNEPEKNLYDRFSKLLSTNTQFFDVLVGYFRASGFYLLKDSFSKVEKTRILIGLNADKQTLSMLEEADGELKNLSNYETIENYKNNLQNEFEKSDDSEDVENGVKQFVNLINSKKLELRVYTKQPIHAKLYIMRDFPGKVDKGRVITGSSNFSQNGLKNNLEFNVELRDDDDVEYALEKFEELWKDAVPVNKECVDTIENKTWIKSDITPYEMYLKFLYEYFKEEINDDKLELGNNNKYYPEGFRPLQYQKDAVIQAKRMLEKHNGIFLSDVVGLGKTYICALLAQELNGGILVLCPPVLKEYWESVLFDFGIRRFTVESEGKLDKIIENGTEKYDYVFVDESHRFRNAGTEQYQNLHQICFGKKVVLISATPQNNYISDIASQLYLFESKNRSSIVGTRNLELFFMSLKRALNTYEKGTDEYKNQVKIASQKVRDEVLREVMIRRTRSEIKKVYGNDLKEQGLVFPEVSDPEKLIYEFSSATEKIFEKTLEDIQKLNYSRYKPLKYVVHSALSSDQRQLLIGQENMGGFMKGILVKRLESSKYAFEQTLNRFIKSYNEFINMYNNGTVWISRKLKVQELLDNDDIDKLLEAVDKQEAMRFESKDFHSSFIKDLNTDLQILNELKELWNSLQEDDKLKYFIKRIKEEKNLKSNKLVIFTESSETAIYLKKELENALGEKVLQFNGSMSDSIRDEIKANFDYNYSKEKQKDEYRILVTTDVLAEGMNLHRSNVIIDYDLPWNPTRIMQRVGRINRVGTPFKKIFVYNFFPTSKSSEQMSLEDNIKTKIQMFYTILGSDAKYLTEDEEVGAFELFKKVNSSIQEEEINDLDMELLYLKEIRDIRDKNPKLYKKIKEFPRKIKIARDKKNLNIDLSSKDSDGNVIEDLSKKHLVTFFRKGYLKRFYITGENGESREISDIDALKSVRAEKDEIGTNLNKDYYTLLKKNKDSFDKDEREDVVSESVIITKKGTSNAKNIIKVLKQTIMFASELTDEEVDKLNKTIDLLEDGELPSKLIKEGNKAISTISGANDYIKYFKNFSAQIPDVYYEEQEKVQEVKKRKQEFKNEIILSEYFD